jgi:hypothetical protein
MYLPTTNVLAFSTDGSERMRITAAGNVSIGNTNDTYKLDVSGTGRFTNTLRIEKSIAYGEYGADSFSINAVNTSTATSKSGNIIFTGFSGNGTSPYQWGYIAGEKDSATGDGSYAGSLTFWTTSGGAGGEANSAVYKRLTISGTGAATFSSSVTAGDAVTITSNISTSYALNLLGRNTTGNASTINFFNNAGSTRYGFIYVDSSTYEIGSINGSNIPLAFSTNQSERMRIDACGNVGIGATTPIDKLHVVGSIYVENKIYNGSNSNSAGMYFPNGTVRIDGYDGITFHSSATTVGGQTERMRISCTGNVGIGTTVPTSKLYIQGGSANWNETTPGTSVGTIHLDPGADTDNIGNAITFGSSDQNNGEDAQAGIYVRSDGTYGTKMYLSTTDSYAAGSKTRLMINSNGNVGIGSSSPSARLQVLATNSTDANNTLTGAWVHVGSSLASGLGIRQKGENAGISGNNFPLQIATIGNLPFEIYTADSQPLVFGTAATERMRIDASGNVGIGVTDTSSGIRLLVNRLNATQDQPVFAWTDAQDNTGYMGIRSAGETGEAVGGASIFADGGLHFGRMVTGAFSERMRITPGGTLLVGDTVTPSEPAWLGTAVLGKTGYDKVIIGSLNSTYCGATIGGHSSALNAWCNLNIVGGDIIFRHQESERVRIVGSSGNVGIGTSNPSTKLHVCGLAVQNQGLLKIENTFSAGTGYPAASFINTRGDHSYGVVSEFRTNTAGDADRPSILFYGQQGAHSWQIGQVTTGWGTNDAFGIGYRASNTPSTFNAWPTNFLTILTSGNVGIGTTAPGSKLHVWNGGVQVTGFPISGSPFTFLQSDYNDAAVTVRFLNVNPSNGFDADLGIQLSNTSNVITDVMRIKGSTGNVGIGTTAPKTKLDVNGAIGFGSKSMSMTDTFAAALTINMADHSGCYVKITAFGDWGNHSTIAYLGEFFIQASAGAYNEPGMIIRQVDNTGGGDDIQAQIVDPAGTGTRDFVIQLKATSSGFTPFTAVLQYEVRGQYNSVS